MNKIGFTLQIEIQDISDRGIKIFLVRKKTIKMPRLEKYMRKTFYWPKHNVFHIHRNHFYDIYWIFKPTKYFSEVRFNFNRKKPL